MNERQPASMLPLPAVFDRLLRLRVHDKNSQQHEKVLHVPCFKPAQPARPRAPTFEDLFHLAPLELVLTEALAAQRICLDAEALLAAIVPLLQQIGEMQTHGRSVA